MRPAEIISVDNDELIGIVASLANTIWREHYTPLIGKAQVDYMLDKFQSALAIAGQIKDGFFYFLIRESEGNYVGYLGIVPKDKEMFLSKLYVLAEKRRNGFGWQAIEFIEKISREKGCGKIVLTVNKNNGDTIQVYSKFGFIITGAPVTDIGNGFVMDDFQLEKMI